MVWWRGRTVQELFGHADIRMTLRYSHLSPAHLLDAVEMLAQERTGTSDSSEKSAEGEPPAKSRLRGGKPSTTPR